MQLCKKHDNKIIDDNDNDFYYISIITKIKKYSSYKRY